MKLRLFRTYKWGYKGKIEDMRFGSDNHLSLIGSDELQYEDETGYWQPVPIVEAEKPEHPNAQKERERMEAFAKQVDDIFKNSKVVTFDEIVSQNEKAVFDKLLKK